MANTDHITNISPPSEFDHTIKVVLIGDSGVGKSCLISRYTDDIFEENTTTTVGIDFNIKVLYMNNKKIKLQIWDTAGQEKFRTVAGTTYRNANGLVLVYDITNRKTFESIKRWYNEVKVYCSEISVILVGNKSDLNNSREVGLDEGRELAKELEVPFIETSSKSCVNVSYCFQSLTNICLENNNVQKKDEDKQTVVLEDSGNETVFSKITRNRCCFK